MGDRFQNEKSGGSSTKKKMAFKVHHSEKTLTTVPLLTENPAVGLAQRIIDLDFSTDLCQHLARLRKKYIDEGLGPLTKVDFDEWALRPENSWQSARPDCGSYGLHVRTVNDLHTTVGFCHKKDGDIYHFKSDKAGLRCHLRNGTSYDVEATGPLAKQAK